jgi:hypothetical protein
MTDLINPSVLTIVELGLTLLKWRHMNGNSSAEK